MFVAELLFRKTRRQPPQPDPVDAIVGLIGFLMNNGQVLEVDVGPARTRQGFSTFVLVPERGSLRRAFNNRFVNESLRKLGENGLAPPRIRIIGPVPSQPSADRCARPRWRVLFTTFIQIASPVRCGDCFAPVPLYRLRERGTFLREHLVFWARAWQACDRLQMGCRVEERSMMRQISDPASKLGAWGKEVCREASRLTKVPTYLYLYRGGDPSRKREERRRCPGCGKKWRLEDPLHRRFDFKCDRCRLVSNIAWSVR